MKIRNSLIGGLHLLLLLPMSLSACANMPGNSQSTTTQQSGTLTELPFRNAADRQDFANWEKAHAVYDHDLAFAALDSAKNDEHEARSALINARLYVAYAEAEQLDLDHPQQAQQDLQLTRDYLSRAALKADPAGRVKIQNLAKSVKFNPLDKAESCSEPPFQHTRNRYEHLKANLDELVNNL